MIRPLTPISLKDAAEQILLGRVSVSALRSEARRGNLATFKIGKNLYTTEADIREMVKKCRVQQSPQGCISEKTTTLGSSGTETKTTALDALAITVQALKDGSPITSPGKRQRPPAKVVTLPRSK